MRAARRADSRSVGSRRGCFGILKSEAAPSPGQYLKYVCVRVCLRDVNGHAIYIYVPGLLLGFFFFLPSLNGSTLGSLLDIGWMG